jgi:hypothetical protein
VEERTLLEKVFSMALDVLRSDFRFSGCASEGIPGIYAKISYFQDWISETIMNN